MATLHARLDAAQKRRKMRIRKKIHGTQERPRLFVFRSLKHISASLVDDRAGKTITGISDIVLKQNDFPVPEDVAKEKKMSRKIELAYRVGLAIADKARENGITTVVFDRNGLRYHGRVRAVAEGARKGGLKF